jgi:hypothetical protein
LLDAEGIEGEKIRRLDPQITQIFTDFVKDRGLEDERVRRWAFGR